MAGWFHQALNLLGHRFVIQLGLAGIHGREGGLRLDPAPTHAAHLLDECHGVFRERQARGGLGDRRLGRVWRSYLATRRRGCARLTCRAGWPAAQGTLGLGIGRGTGRLRQRKPRPRMPWPRRPCSLRLQRAAGRAGHRRDRSRASRRGQRYRGGDRHRPRVSRARRQGHEAVSEQAPAESPAARHVRPGRGMGVVRPRRARPRLRPRAVVAARHAASIRRPGRLAVAAGTRHAGSPLRPDPGPPPVRRLLQGGVDREQGLGQAQSSPPVLRRRCQDHGRHEVGGIQVGVRQQAGRQLGDAAQRRVPAGGPPHVLSAAQARRNARASLLPRPHRAVLGVQVVHDQHAQPGKVGIRGGAQGKNRGNASVCGWTCATGDSRLSDTVGRAGRDTHCHTPPTTTTSVTASSNHTRRHPARHLSFPFPRQK